MTLSLQAIASASLLPASGDPLQVPVYLANIAIPITAVFKGQENQDTRVTSALGGAIDVLLLPYQPPDFDILLGMDFISLFHITLFDNEFILSN